MRRSLGFLGLGLVLVTSRVVLADPEPQDDAKVYSCLHVPEQVLITFKPDTQISELITWAMGFTCNRYVYDPRFVANRHVTVIAPDKMSPHAAYELFLGSLATAGLAVVKQGDAWAIVESQTAKKEVVPVVRDPDDSAKLVRFVLRPAYAKPEVLSAAFESLRSEAGEIKVVGSVLLITDFAAHVKEMTELAKQLDVPGGADGIYTIPVLHADAKKLATMLQELLGAGAPVAKDAKDPSIKVLVDERTNTLIIAGPKAAYERARALVEQIDIAMALEDGTTINVYQLGNAIAEEVAKTLNDAIQRSQATAKSPSSPPSTAPTDPLALEGQVHVIADTKSNKLVISSSSRDFFALRHVIEQLDEPRRQVYIETVILDVDVGNQLNLGASSHGGLPVMNGSAVELGGIETGNVNTLDLQHSLPAGGPSGLLAGIMSTSSLTVAGMSIPSFGVLFTALASTSNSNTVSTPTIMAVDNEVTKFHVGENVPYKKGVVPISTGNPFAGTTTNIDRQDLNFELDIKPHISANDNVLLEITNDSKDLGTPDPILGEPTWNTRGFETRVVVHDQQTIVLTGMTQMHEEVANTKVPLLGDIPLLGYAFKYTTRKRTRSNLLILLTPYIVKSQLDLQAIQERKQREYDEFVDSFRALDHMKFVPDIDYRRKRGLVEEINRAVESVEDETAARASIPQSAHVKPGEVRTSPE
jgi:general secretion pathway protein D